MNVARSASCPWRNVEGRAIVVVPSRNEIRVLNGTGSLAWELLDGTRTIEEVAQELSRLSGADAEIAARDLGAFVEEGSKLGMLERSAAPLSAPPGPAAAVPESYEPPSLGSSEELQVLAAVCDSARVGGEGAGFCRAVGSCSKPFE